RRPVPLASGSVDLLLDHKGLGGHSWSSGSHAVARGTRCGWGQRYGRMWRRVANVADDEERFAQGDSVCNRPGQSDAWFHEAGSHVFQPPSFLADNPTPLFLLHSLKIRSPPSLCCSSP